MITRPFSPRCNLISLVVLMAVCALLIEAASAQASGGASPVVSHTSNSVSPSVLAVQPAVSGLFQVHAPRAWADALDEAGQPVGNGVPDFLDSWEAFPSRLASAILKDDVSAGARDDATAFDGMNHKKSTQCTARTSVRSDARRGARRFPDRGGP